MINSPNCGLCETFNRFSPLQIASLPIDNDTYSHVSFDDNETVCEYSDKANAYNLAPTKQRSVDKRKIFTCDFSTCKFNTKTMRSLICHKTRCHSIHQTASTACRPKSVSFSMDLNKTMANVQLDDNIKLPDVIAVVYEVN